MAPHSLALWFLEAFQPGWGYVIQPNGRKTMRPGRPTAQLLARHLGLDGGPPEYLAIRPSSRTNWVAIDVDQARSPHHPDRGEGALEPLLARLRLVGLRSPLIVQSSHSRGLHLWFPLSRSYRTFDVALSVQLALEAGGLDAGDVGESFRFDSGDRLQVAPGRLEVFPNVKQRDADYNAIRLPFTGQGNGLLLHGWGLVEEPGCLPSQWSAAARDNTLVQAQRISKRDPDASGPYNLVDPETGEVIPVNWVHRLPPSRPSVGAVYAHKGEGAQREGHCKPGSLEQAQALLARGWTGRGQKQAMALAALMVVSRESSDPEEVALLVRDRLVSAPGFFDWCGHTREIDSCAMPGQAACRRAAAFRPDYQGTWKQRANKARADDAGTRALAALAASRAAGERLPSINQAIAHLRSAHGGPSRAWWFRPANGAYLEQLQSLVAAPVRA